MTFDLASIQNASARMNEAQIREAIRTITTQVENRAKNGHWNAVIYGPWPFEVGVKLERYFLDLGFKADYYSGTHELKISWVKR